MATKATVDSINRPRRKLALVIGISEYADGQKLSNAVNDANAMASALRRIGFHVEQDTRKLGVTRKDMLHDIVDFEESIKEGDMVLLYFAGHGTQWEDQNYLIPADNADISGFDLKSRAINAQDLLIKIADRNAFVTIFLFDCCRKYHLRNENLEKRPRSQVDNQSRGLRPMAATAGSLIAFACAPGAIADDGKKGDTHGLFTKHLLKHIEIPNENIISLLIDVNNGVTEESNFDQIPHFTAALRHKNICLFEQTSGT